MDAATKALDSILADLNVEQRAAVGHGNGPLLIVAGAGTGKTTTLAHRVASLIASGVDPGRTLLLTFTRRSSAEMLRRVDGILRDLQAAEGIDQRTNARLSSRKIWGGTFHSVASRLLRRYGKAIGLNPEFTILDRSDSADLMNVLRAELKLTDAETRFPLKGTCQDIYSRCVNTQWHLEKVLKQAFPWCEEHEDGLKKLFGAYVDRKEKQAVLDYDDLLLFWQALVTEPKSAEAIREQFDCVLVDEYQDTNTLQSNILERLCPEGTGLTVVGDDAQSIYSFRAATVRNILDFPKQYPATKVVTLEENYRSTQPILEATNRVIALATERHAKNLRTQRQAGDRPLLVNCRDEDEQTDYIVERILEHREQGVDLKQQAVLFRASHHSLSLEVELSRRNIPFHKYGGLKFIETAHVKDLLAFMRLGENPRDVVSGLRVLMLLPGIGRKRAEQLTGMLDTDRPGFDVWSEFSPPSATAEFWKPFVELMRTLASRTGRKNDMSAEVHLVRKFYGPLLERNHDHAKARLRDLEQLEHVATKFPDRTTFLTEITLDPPTSTQEMAGDPLLDEDYLILSTIHSAKGLEWDSVFVMHAADGNIPSDMATGSEADIEEERRLFYVALTRAKNRLFVCFPQRYYFHNRSRSDAHSYGQLTRFLPQDVLTAFDRRPAFLDDGPEDGSGVAASDVTTADVRARMKKMWS
jgi:DNA helicase-2/ATP-dependent DNA helicase PcrA